MKLSCSIIDKIINHINNPELITENELKAIKILRPTVEVSTVGHMIFVNCFNSEYQIVIDDKAVGLSDIEIKYIISNSSSLAPKTHFDSPEKCIRYIILYHLYLYKQLQNIFAKNLLAKDVSILQESICYIEEVEEKPEQKISLEKVIPSGNSESYVKKRGPKPGTKYRTKQIVAKENKLVGSVLKTPTKIFYEQDILPLIDLKGINPINYKNDLDLLRLFCNSRFDNKITTISNANIKCMIVCIARIKLKLPFSKIKSLLNEANPKRMFCYILNLSFKNPQMVESYIRMMSPLPEPLQITVEELKKVGDYLTKNDYANWTRYSK